MTSLTESTTYEVEIALNSGFTNSTTVTFTTLVTPTITSVSVDDITKTTATATVAIANPDGTDRTVHLQCREKDAVPEDTWTKAMEDTDTGSQEFGLTGLTPGTTYEVQASFDSNFSPHKDTTFTTVFEPSISAVGVGSIEKTTATATVIIANPDGTDKTVNLQYREYNRSPEAEWTKPTPKDTATGSETFDLTSLTPGTTYEVQASFDPNFDTYKDTTFTTKFAPTISAVSVGSITKTTAVATAIIANPDDTTQTVQLQYRIKDPQGNWSSTQEEETTTGSATINLTGLTAGTTYDVEVSLASGFGDTQNTTFTTKFEPSISAVSIGSVAQTTATAAISISNADGSTQTVHLQYREKDASPPANWISATPKTSTTSAASIDISSLTADTTYEVEAWLANDTTKKVTATFTTLEAPNRNPTPSVSSVSMGSITMTTATATINIANPGTAANTVNLRHSVKDANSWTDHTKSETGSTVSFPLSSLIAGTTYEVEAWLGSDTANKVTASFTTSPAPSISSISVGRITRTSATATVNISNSGTAQSIVNLRYSVQDANRWTDHTKTGTGSTVSFPLSGLAAGTTYEVEAWLGSDTDNKATATFTTTLPAALPSPTINSVRVGNILETTATATVSIDNADGSTQTAKLQYRTTNPQDSWSRTFENTSTTGTATINFSGLTANTRYDVQAWLATDETDKETDTFRTSQVPQPLVNNNPPPQRSPVNPTPPVTKSPEVSRVTFADISQTSANATVNIRNAGTAQKTVLLHYRIKDTTAWSTPPKSENTSGSSKTFALTDLTAATTYEVQAWLNTNSPPSGAQIYTFDTLANNPGISNLEFENIGQTSATAMVKIADADTDMKEVFLKHSIDGTDEWTQLPFATITYTDSTSINLTGLEEKTTYQVMVDLTDGFDKPKSATFTTLAGPSLSNVSMGSITQTSAIATVTIADAGTAQKTVHLRYREFGESQWSTAQTRTTIGDSTTFNLSTLGPRTTYEVQASLESDFGISKFAVFTTLSPDPSISGVHVGSITQTSAKATITIANPGTAEKTVYLHYRVSGETEWSPDKTTTTTGASATLDLSDLTSKTTHEVQVSLNSEYADSRTTTFSTLSPDSSVSAVTIGSITQTSAVATVAISNAVYAQKTIYLQYREDGVEEWGDQPLTAMTYGSSVTIELTNLTPGTNYEVRASLMDDFELAQSATFTTLRFPSISNLEVEDETKNSATAVITIADPDGSSQTIHLRHRTTTPQGVWNSTPPGSSTTSEASIALTGLVPDTEYETEVSLTSDFAVSETDTFRTLPPDPVVSGISVDRRKQTSVWANISIANANDEDQTVHLRYRTTTPRGDWIDDLETTSDSETASKEISGLTAGTEYDVQASLDDSFPSSRTKLATFTTLRWPSIASFEEENVGRNGATVIATIADSHGVAQTVYVRHRATGYIAWRPTQQVDSVDDIASVRMRGLSSGTEYVAEASLDELFPSDETKSVTFTTAKRDDDDDASSSGSGIVQAARAVNIPLLGFSPQMLRFVAIEGRDNPAPQTFLVWNRAQGAMSFNLSNHEEWLSQQPMSGVSNGPDDPVTITASVDSSELASGQYVDVINIDVTSSDRSPGQVIVVLDVMPPDYIRQFVSRDEGGVVVLPDGTVKIIVQPLSPPRDVDIELMKVNLQAHGQPPGEQERVVVAIESNTYEPGGDTPEDVAYTPVVELWVQLPQEDTAACDESRARVYSVKFGAWSLLEHRCETDESGHVWAVTHVERLGAFALVIDDAPVVATPTPVAAAVAATPTAIPASAPAVAVQRISLPAQPPTPTPNAVPTAVPAPVGKRTVAPAMEPTPTPTSVPGSSEPPAPVMQASVAEGGSGTLGRIVLATLGAPLLIGALIVAYLLYRERRRRDNLGA